MGRFLFRLIPWWVFAIAAISLVPLAVEEADAYREARLDQVDAMADGPPSPAKVTTFHPARDAGPLGEVAITGALRADLGILELPGDGIDHRAIIMGEGEGPLIAILMPRAEADQLLTEIVSGTDGTGRITLRGFLTDARRTDVRLALERQGVRRATIHVVAPYTGDRAAALQGQVQDALIELALLAGLALLFAGLAAWRLRSWRQRRAAKQRRQPREARPSRASEPDTAFADPSPWEAAPGPWAAAATTPVPLDAPPDMPVDGGETLEKALDLRPPNAAPEFQSVFPGGGSGFRFKTADEIIRQSFGTLTTLAPSKPKV